MLTWRWVKCLPSQLNGPSCVVSVLSIRSIASQKRSRMPIGLALPEAISVPPDLTKPISSRPREITSAVAYSSATRTGSWRTVIKRAHAEEADVLGLARDDAEDHRARAIEAVDPGMVLARGDVEAEFVAQQVFVERLLEEPRRDLRVAISVGQARPHRIGRRRAPPAARTGTGSRNETKRPLVFLGDGVCRLAGAPAGVSGCGRPACAFR